jgi:hypothetical protein
MAYVWVNHSLKDIVLEEFVDGELVWPDTWRTTDKIDSLEIEFSFKIIIDLINQQDYTCNCKDEFTD